MILLLDANAAAGPQELPYVGIHADQVTANTWFLRDLLRHHDLCLPSTHEPHCGHHATWHSPDGGLDCRIDFVAVPAKLLKICQLSSVLTDFDLGTPHLDHEAVAFQIH